MPIWLNFIIILILILINGFFAAAEMALVSVNQHKVKTDAKHGNKHAMRVIRLTTNSTRYLSTIQVAITFAGFLSSALAGTNLSGRFVLLLQQININVSQTVAMVMITMLLSFVTLVFGELVPKRIAMSHANNYAYFSSSIVYGLMIIFKPFVWLLTQTTEGVLRLFGQKKQTEEEKLTEEEIKGFILRGHLEGLYRKEEKDMIENVFRFDDLKASQVMVPRTKVFALSIDDPKLIETFIASKYSRVVLYEHTIDDIIGVLHVKDLFYALHKKKEDEINIRNIIRKPTYVPEDMEIRKVFSYMKTSSTQFAILVDEYGGTVGVLTMEDLVEEIVGNLYDEHDLEETFIKEVKPNVFLVKGDTQIQDINRRLVVQIDENDDRFDTLNGLIITLTGKIPQADDLIDLDYLNMHITVDKVVNHMIQYATIEIKDMTHEH